MGFLSRFKARTQDNKQQVPHPPAAWPPSAAPPVTLVAQPPLSAASTQRRPPRHPVAHRGDDPWRPWGETVSLHGLTLSGGLLNVGENLPALCGWKGTSDASLIRPSLKVNVRNPDDQGNRLGYWPSYSELSPETRAGYLRWLAAGRNHPAAPIGFVFLYFYGLERRLLIDLDTSPAADQERSVLIGEVARLRDLYGHSNSVRSYLGNLLAFATPIDSTPRYQSSPPRSSGWSYQLPFDLAVGLGQLIAARLPMPADWAQAWWQQHPESRQRTPVARCPQEFAEVFAALYTKQYGDGLVVKPGKRTLKSSYRPASPTLGYDEYTRTTDIVDVSGFTAPVAKLAAIAETATDLLSQYSRFIGKNPTKAGSPQALALLPAELERRGDSETVALLDWASSMLAGHNERVVRAVDLTGRWPSVKFLRADAEALAALLARRDIGIEPDVRYGGAVPKPDSKVVLFRRLPDATAEPTQSFLGARALVQLSASVAAADGQLRELEMNALVAHVSTGLHLTDDEQARLRAHLLWVTEHPPTPAALRKRVADFSDQDKEAAAGLLIAVAAADGTITPGEVDAIARLFVILGFQATDAYAHVHALATGTAPSPTLPRTGPDALVDVTTAGDAPTSYTLPPRPADLDSPMPLPEARTKPPAEFTLDTERLDRTLRDSEHVAVLLAVIFDDSSDAVDHGTGAVSTAEPGNGDDAEDNVTGSPRLLGLDAVHSQLVRRLSEQQHWRREQVTQLCSQLGLLVDGALDTINEAALDQVGDTVCDGHDPIEMNGTTLQEIL